MDQQTTRQTKLGLLKKSARLAPICLVIVGAALFSGSRTQLPESVTACVPCHCRGSSNQVGEWLASPYSLTQGGLVCNECHGARCSGVDDSGTGDRQSSGAPPSVLGDFTGLTLNASIQGESVDAEVAVSNLGVGHFLPSGSVPRSLVLEVTARNRLGSLLTLRSGPVFETATGREMPAAGRVFSTGSSISRSPLRDTRLAPFATDVSRYRFAATDGGPVEVAARLLLVPAEGDPVVIAETSTVCHGRHVASGPR